MELRQLRHFLVLAEELHFGRAAERLFLTQPPLSASIMGLERDLGVKLFERNSKRVSLTSAGEAMLSRAHEIVSLADKTQDFAAAIGRGSAGRIEVGFTGILLFRGVAQIFTRFRKSHPQVELSLKEISSQRQSELVRAGRLDAGFLNTPVPPVGVNNLMIFQDRLVACLPAGHRLAGSASIDFSVLRDEPFIMFTRQASPAYYDHLISLCAASGFQPRIELEVLQVQSIVALVAAGMGVSVVPKSVASSTASSAVFVPVQGSPLRPSAFLIWNKDSTAPGLPALIATAEAASRDAIAHQVKEET